MSWKKFFFFLNISALTLAHPQVKGQTLEQEIQQVEHLLFNRLIEDESLDLDSVNALLYWKNSKIPTLEPLEMNSKRVYLERLIPIKDTVYITYSSYPFKIDYFQTEGNSRILEILDVVSFEKANGKLAIVRIPLDSWREVKSGLVPYLDIKISLLYFREGLKYDAKTKFFKINVKEVVSPLR